MALTPLGLCSAAAFLGAALAAPMAAAQPAPDAAVEAICVAQTTLVPVLFGDGMTGQDSITCTDAAGAPLIAGRSELTATGSACGDSATTIKTRWDDGTETVTETTGRVSVDEHTYTATGRVSADSTRFADATVSITGTGVEPSCQNPHLPAAAGYLVTFHRG
ncbi:hypothetical protein [Nocardia sp. NPDC004415]